MFGNDASSESSCFLLEEWPSGFDISRLPHKLQPSNGFAGYFSAPQRAELFAIVSISGPYLRARQSRQGSTALRLVIWSDSILFNADRKEILDANNKLNKMVLTKLVEYK